MKRALVVGCGLSGAVIARELAEKDYKVTILEKRSHIGGNIYDHIEEHGILVHDYGPHTFHTKKKKLYDYICRFADWDKFHLKCGAKINGKCTPTPFNYQTIDDFYSPDEASKLKTEIEAVFHDQKTATVTEALRCGNDRIEQYAQFLFDNDYSLYSAKQWGVPPSEIDPDILKRVPLRFNYESDYFDDAYQVMPHDSYTAFFKKLLDHENISIQLNTNAHTHLNVKGKNIFFDGKETDYPIIYTGSLDELFAFCFGRLPYRSLRFEWKYEDIESFQEMPVIAYPQEPDIVRIIEYKKLPVQNVNGTVYEIEYSLPYKEGDENEPYYPFLTENSKKLYKKYQELADSIDNLYICGRLGNFKYYNMDQALEAALELSKVIINENI